MTPFARKVNQSIVDKVQKILDSTDKMSSLYIEIEGRPGELPIIKYSITELITHNETEGKE